jgi:hypothetical protein
LSKCYYFGLRCDDSAAVWFNSVLFGPDAQDILSNYHKFVLEFNRTFDDPTRVLDAERKLLTMKQGKRSVAQTIPEFKINVFVAGWQHENLYRIFLNILNDDVRDELLKEERPTTLQKYMERAIAIDRQLFERRMDRKTRQHVVPTTRPVPNQRDPSAMDIDSTEVTKSRKLSPEERSRRLKEKLCLYCGQAGHMLQSCPSKN